MTMYRMCITERERNLILEAADALVQCAHTAVAAGISVDEYGRDVMQVAVKERATILRMLEDAKLL